jgi:hypothetical protein
MDKRTHLGQTLSQLGRHAEALADLQRATEFDTPPGSGQVRVRRALILAYAGKHAHATAEASELAKDKAPPGYVLLDLARIWALAASAVSKDNKLAQIDRMSRSEEYAARAVAMLGKARAAGQLKPGGWAERVKGDADFDSLRGREDYQQLFAVPNKIKPG